jgi:hypothetical protein
MELAAWPALMLVIAVGVYLYLRPNRGFRELRASQRALQEAKNWHSITEKKDKDGTWAETQTRDVVCPYDFDDAYADHYMPGVRRHGVLVNGTYYNQRLDGSWTHGPNEAFKQPDCGVGAWIDGLGSLYPGLDGTERNGEVARGEAEKIGDVECVWWEVVSDKGTPANYSVCINENTHLPAAVNSERFGVRAKFSGWGTTKITPPEANP